MAVIGTSNISVQNIGTVLNEAGGSVNINQPLTFFTTSAKINKWSKHKPIPLAVKFCQDYNSAEPDYDADWWKENHCGLKLPFNNTASGVPSNMTQYLGYLAYMASQVNTIVPNYTYTLPTGGAEQPFRLGDFRGYNTDAEQPFKTAIGNFNSICVNGYINRSENNKLALSISRNNSFGGIGLADLLVYPNGYYFIAEVYIYGNGEIPGYLNGLAPSKHLISDQPISNDNITMTYKLDGANDNKNIAVILGVQRVVSGKPIAGEGFICPWTENEKPFMFSFTQYYDFVLKLTPKRFALQTTSLTWVNIPNSTWVNTIASTIILELEIERKAESYYVVGENYSGVQSGAQTVMLKTLNTGGAPSLTPVVGIPCNSSGQIMGNRHVFIEPKTDSVTTSTIYMRFEYTFTKIGQNYAISLQASQDNGATWSNPIVSMNVYINKTN